MGAKNYIVNKITALSAEIDSPTLYVDSVNHKVGIGTTEPAVGLEIAKGPYSATQTEVLRFSRADAPTLRYHSIKTSHYSAAADNKIEFLVHDIATTTSQTSIMTLVGNGRVGIGTTAPAAKLDVSGTQGLPATSGTTQNGIFRISRTDGNAVVDFGFNGSSPYGGWIQACLSTNLATNYPLLLNPNGGNVGIGTVSPATQLQIGSLTSTADQFISMITEGGDAGYLSSGLKLRLHTNDYGWDILSANRASSQAGLDIIRHNNSSTGVSAFFINLITGNVGIGTTTPAYKLDVVGDARISGKIIETRTGQTLSAATDEVSCATSYVVLNYSGNITLITNEVIDTTGAVDGQILHVINGGSDSVITLTCWVAGATEYSKVTAKAGAASIALTKNATAGKCDSASFIFNSVLGRWVQL